MFKTAKPFFLIALSPLHAGSGSELGVIDQPIQRERHTGFPKIEGSSLKGAIREVFNEYLDKTAKSFADDRVKNLAANLKDIKKLSYEDFSEAIDTLFGPDENNDRAASLAITDARLLLFPVKSMKGVFAWITCRAVLKRFREDFKICENCKIDWLKGLPAENTVANLEYLTIEESIILEEYLFNVKCSEYTKTIAAKLESLGIYDINNRLVILTDDDFSDIVNLSTEVITRNKINNETGTAQPGALFTEEYLPTETVMYSLAMASTAYHKKDHESKVFKKNKQEEAILEFFTTFLPTVIQVGGNATIGKGLVKTVSWKEVNNA